MSTGGMWRSSWVCGELRELVAEAITKVREEIAEQVYAEVRFIMPTAETKGQSCKS